MVTVTTGAPQRHLVIITIAINKLQVPFRLNADKLLCTRYGLYHPPYACDARYTHTCTR